MVLIRRFESEMQRLFLTGEVHGTTHRGAGQEAVPVGVCSALSPEDYLAGTYRSHGHGLAKGTDPDALLAEMLGRITGVWGGRAGSEHELSEVEGASTDEGAHGAGGGVSARRALSRSRRRERHGVRAIASAVRERAGVVAGR
jgi:acetoin:2,6-dichlorophenolindophenol oxidoreductase subunit alpha